MRGVHWMWIAAVVQGFVLATPLAGLQFCGRELANAMAMVCNDRGYNMAFRPEPSGESIRSRRASETRIKRGIVDECCKAGCSWSTLEAYCKPAPSTPAPSDSLLIRKRSDLSKNWNEDSEEGRENKKFSYVTDHHNHFNSDNIELKSDGTRHHKRKLFGHLEEDKRNGHFFTDFGGYKSSREGGEVGNKVKRNNDKDGWSGGGSHEIHPLFRHHTDRLSIEKRHKRLKEAPQVGTISPYFFGRTLVSPTSRQALIPHY